jgi:hypothetical protein
MIFILFIFAIPIILLIITILLLRWLFRVKGIDRTSTKLQLWFYYSSIISLTQLALLFIGGRGVELALPPTAGALLFLVLAGPVAMVTGIVILAKKGKENLHSLAAKV